MITLLLRLNDVATLFWRNDNLIVASRVRLGLLAPFEQIFIDIYLCMEVVNLSYMET